MFNSDKSPALSAPLQVLLWMTVGIGIGAAVGVAMDNLSQWLVMGVCLGGAIGGSFLISSHWPRLIFSVFLIAIGSVVAVVVADDSGRVIQVKVDLDTEADKGFTQDWPVYVYAASPGTKLPLASKSLKLSELPAQVKLTEADYVLPGLTMKDHTKLVVTVKVSSDPDVHKTGPEDSSITSAELIFDGPGVRHTALVVKAPE